MGGFEDVSGVFRGVSNFNTVFAIAEHLSLLAHATHTQVNNIMQLGRQTCSS